MVDAKKALLLRGAGSARPLRGHMLIDFTTMPDGVPGDAQTGERLWQAYDGVGPAEVENGALVVKTVTATYNTLEGREDIEEVIAETSFSDANDVQALILLPGKGQLAVGAYAAHFSYSAGSYNVQYYTQDVNGNISNPSEASGTFANLPYGSKTRIGFKMVPGVGFYLILPISRYGTRTELIAAPNTAARINHCLTFEHYRFPSDGNPPGGKFYVVAGNYFASPEAAGKTNLFVAPRDFGDAAWTKQEISAPSIVPLGQQMLETTVSYYHWAFQNYAGVPAATPTRMSLRFDAATVGRDWVSVACFDGQVQNAAFARLNLTTGELGTGTGAFKNQYASIYPLGNGLSRVQLEFLTSFSVGSPDGVYAAIGSLLSGDGSGDVFAGDPTKGIIVRNPYLFVR